MAESAEIKKVSIKHESIMNYIMENPQTPLRDVAAFFGISQSWLSTVIHSPAFQDRLAEKKDVLFHHTVVSTIKDKISVLAHKALDKLNENIDFMSTKETRETAEMALEGLGYVGKSAQPAAPAGVTNNNTYFVARELFVEAQNRIGAKSLQGPADAALGVLDHAPTLQLEQSKETVGTRGPALPSQVFDGDGEAL